jgi:hypothetical protein
MGFYHMSPADSLNCEGGGVGTIQGCLIAGWPDLDSCPAEKPHPSLSRKRARETGRMFFFEKKNQKTFVPCTANPVYLPRSFRSARIKVFLLLFLQKKKTLPYLVGRGGETL